MSLVADLIGTLQRTLFLGPAATRATLDAQGLTAPRTLQLPDQSGAVAVLVENAASPNNTVPVQVIAASNGVYTDIDLALLPKGAGGLSLAIADGTATGGNKRGARAVDLQTSRAANTQVASGADSFIGGSASSTASNQRAAVIGCSSSAASGQTSLCGASTSSSASATRSFALGSNVSTANGANGGSLGGAYGNGVSRQGFTFTGCELGNVSGRHQSGQMTLCASTADGAVVAAVAATANGATAATGNQMALQNNSVLGFRGKVVARNASNGDSKRWEITGLIKRGANAAATALVGTPTKTVVAADTGASGWDISAVADATNGALQLQVTGQALQTIRWSAAWDIEEVT